jgi:hypothetical protein
MQVRTQILKCGGPPLADGGAADGAGSVDERVGGSRLIPECGGRSRSHRHAAGIDAST